MAAYLDAPLPSLFKERLFVHLSRFCEVRYCVIRHACFLAGLRRPAGDPRVPGQTVEAITALLRRPVPAPSLLEEALRRLEASPALAAMPAPGTQREADLFEALTVIFLDTPQAPRARAAVTAAAGNPEAELLMGLLAFIRTAHHWTEIHADLPLEPDATAFLDQHPELARLLTQPVDAVAANPRAAWHAAVADREAQQRAQREFVANAAHELRTPLTAVIAAIETLDRGRSTMPPDATCSSATSAGKHHGCRGCATACCCSRKRSPAATCRPAPSNCGRCWRASPPTSVCKPG
jgi:signal transduction histidine kinase